MADGFGMPGMGGGGMDMMGMFYPQLLGPMRQMAYGQALLQQGSEMTPLRSPWQAIARGVSGALGGYETSAGLQAAQGAQQEMQARSDAAVREALGGPLPGQQQPPQTTAQPQPGAQPGAQPQAKPAGKMVAEPTNLSATYDTAASSSGIPRNILVAKDSVETGGTFDNSLVSSTGAAGIPQILASTADNPGFQMTPLGAENRTNPDRAIPFGANYLAARGKALFGDQWDPNNPAQMHAALKAYGDGTDAYADKVMAASGAPAVPPVIAAVSNSTLGAPPVQGGMAQSQELAVRYERAAMALSGSMNPQDRMRAQMFLQQAQFYRQQGAWTDPAEIQPGIFAQRNTFTGETKIQGRATPVEKDANGNLVRTSDGSIVSASNGYRPSGRVSPDGRSTEIIGPDGKPEWIAPQQTTAETQQQDDYRTLTSLSDPVQKGTASEPQKQAYNIAYARLGAPEMRYNPTTNSYDPVPSTKLPPNIYQPPGAPRGFAPPAPSAAPAPGAQPPPAAPATVQPSAPATATPMFATGSKSVDQQMEREGKTVGEAQTAANDGRDVYGTIQAVRSMMARGVHLNYGGTWREEVANTLKGMGWDPAKIQSFTGTDVAGAEVVKKELWSLVTQASRKLGAREPGSVVKMFTDAYPSLDTDPDALNGMLGILEMQQRYNEDYATGMNNYLSSKRGDLMRTGDYAGYKGIGDFNQEFMKAYNPRTYINAGLAYSGQPISVWGGGGDAMQDETLRQLVRQYGPTTVNMGAGKATKTVKPDDIPMRTPDPRFGLP